MGVGEQHVAESFPGGRVVPGEREQFGVPLPTL
jgi:hypothetical protein